LHEVLEELKRLEQNDAIAYGSLHQAIQLENERLERVGERRKFRTARDGEERGWVSLEAATGFVPGTAAQQVEAQIVEANRKVDEEVAARLRGMSWRAFEDTFLTRVLEKLGFQNVQVTQPTRDGGVDARVTYKRGLVEARAIVSAKRWSKASVPVAEVRNLRGIYGEEDTAIVITTGRFTEEARQEAIPRPNMRAVYLIDGDQLSEICKEHDIGVKKATLPPLLMIDEEAFTELEEEVSGSASSDDEGETAVEPTAVKRFRDEMLGDRESGISVEEVANLLGLTEGTVRTYLSIPARRQVLGERIRSDSEIRAKALELVARRRLG
jgi:restriction endonuclease Mrr